MNLKRVKEILQEEPKLIEIQEKKKIVFVGDTHGDFKTSQKVVEKYLSLPDHIIVFLGDYVDRGASSKENLDFLLEIKEDNPQRIYLLQGNHEGHRILKFFPADFWEGLSKRKYEQYSSIVEEFPLVFSAPGIIALHGILPDVDKLEEISQIDLGSQEWRQITWGDFVEREGEFLGMSVFTGRPQFGEEHFFKIMKRFNKKVLVRSHQCTCPRFMFNDRCVTICTSSAYKERRSIAVVDLSKKIKNGKDLDIVVL